MELAPEVATSIRTLLTVAGTTLVVKPGIMDQPMLEMAVGAIVVLMSVLWSFWSKRPQSAEAQIVAQKVMDAPDVPGPVDRSVEENA